MTLTASILGDTGTAPGLADTCTLGERSPRCCKVKFTMAELGFWTGTGWLEVRAGLFPTGTAATEVGETISFRGVTWKEGKLTAVSSDDVTGITPGKKSGGRYLKSTGICPGSLQGLRELQPDPHLNSVLGTLTCDWGAVDPVVWGQCT